MTANIQQHVLYRGHRRQYGSVSQPTIAVTAGLLALVTLSVIGFFYLQQVFTTASQGSDIHALENKVLELKNNQKTLELEGAQLRSLQTIEQRVNDLHLVPSDTVSYLVTSPDKVATTLH